MRSKPKNEFRFAIGIPFGQRSNSWKLWSIRDDIYLVQRNSGSDIKFSFHKSGICRWAQTKARTDGLDRVLVKWNRDPIEPTYKQKTTLVSFVFPTNHLSTAYPEKVPENLHWIRPAPSGLALQAKIFLTAEDEKTLQDDFASQKMDLIFFGKLESKYGFGLALSQYDCGPINISMPREPVRPGQVFGTVQFPEYDSSHSGRPLRMLMRIGEQNPPILWELGGYQQTPL